MKDKLATLMGAIGSNKILNIITNALVGLMPILMIGSIGALFQQIPFGFYQQFITSTGIINVFRGMVNVTTNLLALYAAFSIGYNYAKKAGHDGYVGGLLTLACFLINVPLGTIGETTNALPLTWLGSTGLFTAMIMGILVPKLYCWLVDHNVTVSLPDSVPSYIGKAFTSIIPGIAVSLVFAVVAMVMSMTPFGSLPAAIFALIGAPLSGLGTTIWATILVRTLMGLCWWFGIHGGAVMMAMAPVLMAADAENVAAVSAGLAPTNIITMHWSEAMGNIGGAGCTLGLVLCCVFLAKSKRFKEFGKLTIAPSLFGINEPVVFGLPCMLNPFIALPFIFLPVVLIALSYVLVLVGILPVGNGVAAPASIPILYGLLNSGWRGAVWNAVEIVISFLVYLPFFKVLDKQACDEEHESEQAVSTEA